MKNQVTQKKIGLLEAVLQSNLKVHVSDPQLTGTFFYNYLISKKTISNSPTRK